MKSKRWREKKRTKCIIASFKVDHIVPLKEFCYAKRIWKELERQTFKDHNINHDATKKYPQQFLFMPIFQKKKTIQNRLFKMFYYGVQTSFDLLSSNVSHIFIVLLNIFTFAYLTKFRKPLPFFKLRVYSVLFMEISDSNGFFI